MEELTESSNSTLSFFVEKDKVIEILTNFTTGMENQEILQIQNKLTIIVSEII